jgi:apolipoprotein N-acyltransferase
MFSSLIKKDYFKFFLIILSFFIVGFGQNARISFFGAISSVIGYSLFWMSLSIFDLKKNRFFLSLFWFCCVQFIQLSWMTSISYQGIYILLVYSTLCIILGLQFAFVSCFVPIKKPLFLYQILAISGFWTILEWQRLFWLSGFSWNPIGMSLANSYIPMQMAAIVGVYGLSFWVLFVNLLGYKAFFLERIRRNYLAWLMCAIFPYIFGFFHLLYHQKNFDNEKVLPVVLIQTALKPEEKFPFQSNIHKFIYPAEQWARIFSFLKDEKLKKIDLIVFPEIALPFEAFLAFYPKKIIDDLWEKNFNDLPDLHKQNNYMEKKVSNAFIAKMLSNYFQADVIIGLEDRNKLLNHNYNSAFCFNPHTENYQRYLKRILVPLAEYFPFSWCEKLAKIYGIGGQFTPGKKPGVFFGKNTYGVSICYEETYGNLIRECRRKGANIFVNLTNDVWFPFSKLPKQHFEHGRLRSVENGVPLLRSCNTGVTGGIDAFGRVVKILKKKKKPAEMVSSALYLELPIYNYKTLYTKWGDYFIICFSVLFLSFAGACYLKKK